jgi:pentatricopeptide repeat protein
MYHTLIEHNCTPNDFTFTALDGCKDKNGIKYFEQVIEFIRTSSVSRSVALYNIIISKCFHMDMINLAFQTLEGMEIQGVRPNVETYWILLSDASSLVFINKTEKRLLSKQNKDAEDNAILMLTLAKLITNSYKMRLFGTQYCAC